MFETERLIIRPIETSDLALIRKRANSAEFMRTSTHFPLMAMGEERVKKIFMHKPGELPHYCICFKPVPKGAATEQTDNDGGQSKKTDDTKKDELPECIGTIGFHSDNFDFKNRVAEMGLGIFSPEHRGIGIGGEAMRWAIDFAFNEFGLHKLELRCYTNNPGGIALYMKLGFVQEGCLRKTYYMTGKWYDTIAFGMLEEEFFAKAKTAAAKK